MCNYNFPGGPRRKRWIRRSIRRVWPWCCWCGKKLDEASATIEHIIPHGCGGGHERERYAGVPTRRLDDDRVLVEDAALLRIRNHGRADTVLDAAQRILKFALEENGGV